MFFTFELFGVSVTLCHSVTLVMGVTLVTYVTFVSNIIVMCHWSPKVSQETSYNCQKVLSKPSADSFAVGRRQKV
jgi:hypothetical protein